LFICSHKETIMTYEDHLKSIADFEDSYGNEADPAAVLTAIVLDLGETLSTITGPSIADPCMLLLARSISGPDVSDWRAAITDNSSSVFSDWKLGRDLFAIAAYARYGVNVLSQSDCPDPESFESFIEDSILRAESLMGRINSLEKVDPAEKADFIDTIIMARARWQIDHAQPVHPEGLARLAGLSDSRMRSLAKATPDAILHMDERRNVAWASAAAWLETQPRYRASIWRVANEVDTGTQNEPLSPDEYIFVPQAADGSQFLPNVRQPRGFQIGVKGREVIVEDYLEALNILLSWDKQFWRRPSATSGKPSIVVGTTFARVKLSDIGL
jgi:hypothetical protein